MQRIVSFLGNALQSMALLFVVAALAPMVLNHPRASSMKPVPMAASDLVLRYDVSPPLDSPQPERAFSPRLEESLLHDPVFWCLAFLLSVSLLEATCWTRRSVPQMLLATRRSWAVLHPRHGLLGRWFHLSFCEPLAAADQAREALARLCGYRLQPGDYQIRSIRPSICGWRLGAWVTVARRSQSTRRWECCYKRWVDDPNELWLLRSSLRAEENPAVVPPPNAGPSSLETMSKAEVEGLFGKPAHVS